MGPTSGPEVLFFKRFMEAWPKFDRTKFESGISDLIVEEALRDVRDDLGLFLSKLIRETHQRSDYREFVELSLLFLNIEVDSSTKLFLRAPGPISHARWMAKALYSLKMFMCRKFLQLTANEINRLREICIFLIRIYVKAWFRTPFAIEAPLQDLNLAKILSE